MTVAFRTLMNEFYIPCMGVKAMRVEAFEGNVGSVRVFEKNGFVMIGTVENCMPVQESKGGGKDSIHVLSKST